MFNDEQLLRYNRHLLLPEFDIRGQQALAKARILIVGIGGLGCPAALYLAASGVGQLLLADQDTVELSNLQRQILFKQQQLSMNKVDAAKQTLEQLNKDTRITRLPYAIEPHHFNTLANQIDLVLDCSDNAKTRQLVNQACFTHQLPLVSGAAIGWQGQLSSFNFTNAQNPCYHCLFGDITEDTRNCSESGIMSPVAGIIGAYQALEAIKIMSQTGMASFNTLHCFDGLSGHWQEYHYQQNPNCPVCSKGRRY